MWWLALGRSYRATARHRGYFCSSCGAAHVDLVAPLLGHRDVLDFDPPFPPDGHHVPFSHLRGERAQMRAVGGRKFQQQHTIQMHAAGSSFPALRRDWRVHRWSECRRTSWASSPAKPIGKPQSRGRPTYKTPSSPVSIGSSYHGRRRPLASCSRLGAHFIRKQRGFSKKSKRTGARGYSAHLRAQGPKHRLGKKK